MRMPIVAALFVGLSLAPASAQQQPTSPSTRGFLNGTEFILERPFTYIIGSTRTSITIPAGFVTDFASIPGPLRGILERQGQYSRAALVHDYLYWMQGCSRLQADNLLMIAMKESAVGTAERNTVYRGVRAGGSSAWRSNRRDRRSGKPRVVPANMFDLADHHNWRQARAVLITRGVRDPSFSVDPAACQLGYSTRVP